MEVKDIIKQKRLELGLTYEQLGNLVGVGKSTVRKWEIGMIENMRRDNIIALSKALNISPAVLMGWSDEEIEYCNEKKDIFVENTIDTILKQLIDSDIITDIDNIDKDTENMILSLVKRELKKLKKKR